MRHGVADIRSLIVIPTFNEVNSLRPLIEAIHGTLPLADILVVDDASLDGTGTLADRLAARDARVNVRHRPSKLGLGTAYMDGFEWGLTRGYDRFFEMDADLSHDPRYLPSFVAELDAGADVVVGSRNMPGGGVEGWGIARHVISKGGSLYSRLVLNVSVRDMTSGFKGYSRRALERLDLAAIRSNGYAFQIETTYRALRAGLRVVEVPIAFVDRRVGQSKMSRKDVFEGVWRVWAMRGEEIE
jgi:dolichol-phosphate mannosyltransferase